MAFWSRQYVCVPYDDMSSDLTDFRWTVDSFIFWLQQFMSSCKYWTCMIVTALICGRQNWSSLCFWINSQISYQCPVSHSLRLPWRRCTCCWAGCVSVWAALSCPDPGLSSVDSLLSTITPSLHLLHNPARHTHIVRKCTWHSQDRRH